MSTTVQNFVIRHMAGAKANQIEEFDFQKHNELSLGRASTSDVQFDPDLDTVVSREHGKIVKDSIDPLSFMLIDNNSRNGIMVNKIKVKGSTRLYPGDEIQLGNNGPIFVFDLDPRPQEFMPQTRMVDISKPTAEFIPTEVANTANTGKTGIGKQTFERVITHERKKSQRMLWTGLAAALVLVSAVSFVVWKNGKDKNDEMAAQMGNASKQLDSLKNSVSIKQQKGESLSPEEIVAANQDKVVKIEFGWQLFDPSTSDEIWHVYIPMKMQDGSERYMAAYIQNSQGRIEPYLNTKRNVAMGVPIGMTGASGSGFVVSDAGFILTNRHVAASWNTGFSFPEYAFPGVLLDAQGKATNQMISAGDVYGWVPSETSMLGGRALNSRVEGRNTYLKVTFANNVLRRNATVEAVSDNHDAAMIKVSMPGKLASVELLDNYDDIKAGQAVTVMGYPGVAPEQYVVRKSSDPFKPNMDFNSVPSPTVTPGNIGRLIKTSTEKNNLYSTFGDSYQLTINATGGGNSGGPMFDDKGRVIGIYYAGKSDARGTQISFAVPIKYGMELMGNTKVL
ncbi:trypsin-like peptidase domain-containing protein [Emticicia agri]|uniref:FHA domain-containing protein n=1 Tax=Emticicia agri TaxID=2492393 RepID=A0A4Q5LWU7_9BACT|nr:trypsin-like peptidase domain-containing protein [Emticicia agri]RYU94281.1 FHA domain-containing protein [Emticicia agri]